MWIPIRVVVRVQVLLAYSWLLSEIANASDINYELAANTVCLNPFEAFTAAALKAMGKPRAHNELQARRVAGGKPMPAWGRVELVARTTKNGIKYKEYQHTGA